MLSIRPDRSRLAHALGRPLAPQLGAESFGERRRIPLR
jgi:hypothetical protein